MEKDDKKKNQCDSVGSCFCTYCDGEISTASPFCQPCNKKFVACPKCQVMVEADSAKCPKCGNEVH